MATTTTTFQRVRRQQRLREADFMDAFTPRAQRDWQGVVVLSAGATFGRSRVRVGPEVSWRRIIGDVRLAQLRFTPVLLDGWGLRLRLQLGR